MSNSLRPHGPYHARLICPSPMPGTYSNSCPSSRWCHPTISTFSSLLQSLPDSGFIFFSFSSESVLCIRWSMYWSFSFSISPSNEYSELISFRMDWLDFLEVRGTLKSLLQNHNSKASILRWSAFFMVQLSHPHMTTGKTIPLSRWILAGKVMSLLFNRWSNLVLVFLPRSKSLLISWLQSSYAMILEPEKIRSATISNFSPSIYHEVMRPVTMVLVFWMLSFKAAFSFSSFTSLKRLFSSSSFSAVRVLSPVRLRYLIFLLQSWFQLVLQPVWYFSWCTLHVS